MSAANKVETRAHREGGQRDPPRRRARFAYACAGQGGNSPRRRRGRRARPRPAKKVEARTKRKGSPRFMAKNGRRLMTGVKGLFGRLVTPDDLGIRLKTIHRPRRPKHSPAYVAARELRRARNPDKPIPSNNESKITRQQPSSALTK